MTHRPPVTPALAALLPFALLGPAVFAYNPPTDQAGRLSVRIEGPAEVTETGVALPLGVVLRNGGQSQLRGTVRLRVIDQWKADPDGAVRFQLGPGETAVLPFSITGGDLHRQCVAWSGGERVWVNRGQTDWPVGETLLPEYAFLAECLWLRHAAGGHRPPPGGDCRIRPFRRAVLCQRPPVGRSLAAPLKSGSPADRFRRRDHGGRLPDSPARRATGDRAAAG